MTTKFQARQGDLLIERIAKLPKGAKKVSTKILAYGEATGHMHQLEAVDLDKVNVFVDENGGMFVEALTECKVSHDEHGTVPLKTGVFEVIRQREYDPSEAARERMVRD